MDNLNIHRSVPFRAPNGTTYRVDEAFDHPMLSALNSLPGLKLWQICAGHPRCFAYAIFKARSGAAVLAYLRAGIILHYQQIQVIPFRTKRTWHLEFRHEDQQPGEVPQRWWQGLRRCLEAVRP